MPIQPPLTERLRKATRALHTEVERAGVMRLLLRGQLGVADYCRLLRNLHAVYAPLESGLSQHRDHPAFKRLPCIQLFRSEALNHDLAALHGPNWPQEIALACAAEDYAAHLRAIAESTPIVLAAHAYVRYLGDLSGGQMLARIVGKGLGLMHGAGVSFYDFGPDDDVARLAKNFRTGLDQLVNDETSAQMIVDEACAAFARHRDLFEQLAPTPPL